MAKQLSAWNKLVQSELRALPKGASKHERGQAMKRASAKWRGMKGSKEIRSNPTSRNELIKYLIIGGIALYVVMQMRKQAPVANGNPPMQGQ